MRIIHISDSHIGHTAYRRTSPDGYNQRGEDMRAALTRAIDVILELKPDIVLHTGDLFDSPRPLNRMTEFAFNELMRLTRADIPVILLAGNHETPKQRTIGHVFALLDTLQNTDRKSSIEKGHIYPVYKGRYEQLTYAAATFHCVPHCEDQERFETELQKISIVPGKKNIGLFHAGVSGVREFREAEFNEQLLTDTFLKTVPFDYCALGHLHRMVEVEKSVWYAGSTERLSFGEVSQKKGLLLVDTDTGTVTPHIVPTRVMVERTVTVTDLSAQDAFEAIKTAIEDIGPGNKVLKIRVSNIAPATYAALDFTTLRALTAPATHCELIFERVDQKDIALNDTQTIQGLSEEFSGFCARSGEQSERAQRVKEKGLSLLKEVMEQ